MSFSSDAPTRGSVLLPSPPHAAPDADPERAAATDRPPVTVELLRWPADADRRAALARAGRPRLLLIEPGAPPPMTWDPLEDWVREPAGGAEVEARARGLLDRPEVARPGPALPVLDADGLLRHDGRWVAVPPIESRVLAALLNRVGSVVGRADLLAAGWPHGAPSDHGLDARMRMLRRRIRPLGLVVHTVRGVGFLLGDPRENHQPAS